LTSEDSVGSSVLFSKESLGYRIYAAKDSVDNSIVSKKKFLLGQTSFWIEIVMEKVSKANYWRNKKE
jgi:hypothetical protein